MTIIDDKSSDHKYFTIVPNIVIDKSRGDPQALYAKLKRHSRRNGEVDIGDNIMIKMLGWGKKRYYQSLQHLIENGFMKRGKRKRVMTPGGPQWKNTYVLSDIWKRNSDYYSKGSAKIDHLSEKEQDELNGL